MGRRQDVNPFRTLPRPQTQKMGLMSRIARLCLLYLVLPKLMGCTFTPKSRGGVSQTLGCTAFEESPLKLRHKGFRISYGAHMQNASHEGGKIVTVVNRSEVVGRPLAAMLANDGDSSNLQ